MADMPSSGVITFDDLLSVFGGSEPVAISAYYRGGGLVPNIAQNDGVPTSGAISLADFYGAGTGGTSGTLTAGRYDSSGILAVGKASLYSIGSTSPTSALGGTISLMANINSLSGDVFGFEISGLSADPGQDIFETLTVNGTALSSSGVISYAYDSGAAEWYWGTQPTLVNGDTYDWSMS